MLTKNAQLHVQAQLAPNANLAVNSSLTPNTQVQAQANVYTANTALAPNTQTSPAIDPSLIAPLGPALYTPAEDGWPWWAWGLIGLGGGLVVARVVAR